MHVEKSYAVSVIPSDCICEGQSEHEQVLGVSDLVNVESIEDGVIEKLVIDA